MRQHAATVHDITLLFLQVLVQRLQKDILPKIESQIAELSKQDEPNDATKAITKQLKVHKRVFSLAIVV